MAFNTPVLFLIYKNSKVTKEVFDEIIKLKPLKLYIAADGPKNDSEEAECLDVRAITDNIDWECEVHRRYLDNNLGCKKAVSSAISWLFDNEERGIILEYDCLPHKSFFTFCESMLVKYENNKSIMHIGGSNFQDGIIRGDGSYYFSAVTGVWGWATWRRSWEMYDSKAHNADRFINSNRYRKILTNKKVREYWAKRFLKVENGVNTSSWAIPWAYSVMKCNGLCVTPNENLISNIGFNINGTHAFDENSIFSRMAIKDIGRIIHPNSITIDHEADNYAIKKSYKIEDSTFVVIKSKIKKYLFPLLPKIVKNKLLEFNQNFLR